MNERLEFVARLLDGEQMASLCREFGISRKTGYKIFNHYKECGLEGLEDRSQRPIHPGNRIPLNWSDLFFVRRRRNPVGVPQKFERNGRYPFVGKSIGRINTFFTQVQRLLNPSITMCQRAFCRANIPKWRGQGDYRHYQVATFWLIGSCHL